MSETTVITTPDPTPEQIESPAAEATEQATIIDLVSRLSALEVTVQHLTTEQIDSVEQIEEQQEQIASVEQTAETAATVAVEASIAVMETEAEATEEQAEIVIEPPAPEPANEEVADPESRRRLPRWGIW